MRKRKRGYRRGKWGCILLLLVGMAGFLYVTRDSGYKFPEVLSQKGEKEVEEVDYLPAGDGELVRHVHYSLSFDTCHKQAEWVYYLLDLKGKEMKVPRTDRFEEDPQVSSGSAKPSDYSRSGYDRGHLCPAADMAYSAEAMRETFLMSNISPQMSVFNRGIWKKTRTTAARVGETGTDLYRHGSSLSGYQRKNR